jgi:hypothetical protein
MLDYRRAGSARRMPRTPDALRAFPAMAAPPHEAPASDPPDAPHIDGVRKTDRDVAERAASAGAGSDARVADERLPAATSGAVGRGSSMAATGAAVDALAAAPVCRPDGPRAG